MSYLNDSKNWRDRAEATRTKAEKFWDDDAAKTRLPRIAQEYDRVAEQAEMRSGE